MATTVTIYRLCVDGDMENVLWVDLLLGLFTGDMFCDTG